MNSKANLKQAISSDSTFVKNNAKHLQALSAQFSGVSLVDSVMARTQPMVEFLAVIGLDFQKKQTKGKTMAQYVDGLIKAQDDAKLVSDADKKYVCALKTIVEGFETAQKQKPHNPAVAAGQGTSATNNGLVAAAAAKDQKTGTPVTKNAASQNSVPGAAGVSDVSLLLQHSAVIEKVTKIPPTAAIPAKVELVTSAASVDSGSQIPAPK